MKMYKVAQSDGDDNIVIRVTTNKEDGTFKSTVLGHTGEATCSDGLDEAILKYILETEIEGFGNLADVTGMGDTGEAHAMAAPHAVPTPTAVVEEDEEEDEGVWSGPAATDRTLGYGV